MNETRDRIEEVFAAAVELPAEARTAYLDQACAGDSATRARVEALLQAHDRAGHLLDRPAVTVRDTGERPGTVIAGRYKLLEALGEGGMGTVWGAEQTEPVRRKVALKLIKPGMDSRQVLARFEQERQALALMDHPNIAKVLDGGLTETGRPFFVMEYVKGVPITQYCDAARLSVSERLQLFVQVCQAVQHAHMKGIIHRDLKPSNILVAPYDDKPVPKVIDFGLAKAMHQPLTERTLHTAHEAIVGTPLYMSPEQAQLNNLDVDTRTDIYSLGALLYELLTGTPPVERQRFKEAAWQEIIRIIKEEEPPRPSARLSSSGSLPSVAAQRQVEPAKLTKLVRGELDWIVMKALEKDRNRRYETANGFALDVQRFLSGEPVLVVPPSASYRLRKFARKHRAALTTAAVIAVLLVAGIVGTAIGLLEALAQTEHARAETRAKEKALQAEAEARAAEKDRADSERTAKEAMKRERDAKEEALRKEEKERKYAQAIADFVQNDFLALTSVEGQSRFGGDSEWSLDKDTTLRQLLDRAAAKLNQRRDLDPRIEADLCWMVGVNYRGVGEPRLAIPFLERAVALRKQVFGVDHRETLTAQNSLGVAYEVAGKFGLALPLYEETLKLRKSKLGADDPETLASMNNLAECYKAAGKLDLALPLFEETLKLHQAKLGADHRSTLISMNNLATAYAAVGKLDLALPLLEETLKLRHAKLGADHPDTLRSMNNLAMGYKAVGKLDLALPLLEETLKLQKSRLGADHPNTLRSMNNLALAYAAVGKLDLALPLLEETLKLRKSKQGADHPDTLTSMNNLAYGYQDAGKLDLALPLFQEAAAGVEKRRFQHEHAGMIVGNLIRCYDRLKRFDEADVWRRKWVAFVKECAGAESLPYADQLAFLGFHFLQRKKWSDAETVLRDSLAIREKKQPDSWTMFYTHSMLGGALLNQQKYADAEPMLLKGYEGMKQRADKIPAQVRTFRMSEAVELLVQLYEATGNKDEAAKWRKELEAIKKP
jgi:serine/threonine protein kinase